MDGRHFVRDGAHNTLLAGRSLRNLLLARGDGAWEALCPAGSSSDDLDLQQIQDYCTRMQSASMQDLLVHRGYRLGGSQVLLLVFADRIEIYGQISSREYQELCPGVTTESLRRDFLEVVGKGLVLRIGDKRGTYYIMKNPANHV